VIGFCLISFLSGIGSPLQSTTNRTLTNHVLTSFRAVTISMCGSAIILSIGWLISLSFPNIERTQDESQWWTFTGGLFGNIIVLFGTFFPKFLGMSSYYVVLITGQLTTSMIVDHFGLLGFSERPVDLRRIIGVVLALVGVGFVKYQSKAKNVQENDLITEHGYIPLKSDTDSTSIDGPPPLESMELDRRGVPLSGSNDEFR